MKRDADVVVVGSGLGGLTAAATLARSGRRVIVCEQSESIGGSGSSFVRRGDLTFDVGVHVIGDCGPGGSVRRILDELGTGVELLPLDPDAFDVIVFGDRQEVRIPVGWDRYRDRLCEAVPLERDAMARCVDLLERIALEAGEPGAASTRDPLARLRDSPSLARWGLSPLGRLFDELGLGPRARSLLAAQSGNYALPPSQVATVAHARMMHDLLSGPGYPKGGGGVIAEALATVVRRHGGEIRVRSAVQQILVEGGRVNGVLLEPGEVLRCTSVVSNADPRRTLLELVPPGALQPRTIERARSWRSAFPLFGLYLTIEADLRARLGRSSLWLHPSDDVEGHYRLCTEGRLSAAPPIYVSAGASKDPSCRALAPSGACGLEIFTVVPPETDGWHRGRVKDGAAYDRIRKVLEGRVMEVAARLLPELGAQVSSIESATPATFSRFLGSPDGAAYGLALTSDQVGSRRPDLRTEIGGLWLVGGGTRFGHGVAGALRSGRACAALMAAGAPGA